MAIGGLEGMDPALDSRAGLRFLRGRLPGDLPLHVVGHSRGGVPALDLALSEPDVVSAAAIGPARRMLTRMDDRSDLTLFWDREVERRRQLFRSEMPSWFGIEQFRDLMRRNALERVAPALRTPGHLPVLFIEGDREPADDRAYLPPWFGGSRRRWSTS